MLRSLSAVLMILLAAPACAGSRSSGGFHGAGSHRGFPLGGFASFHRRGGRARVFLGNYSYGCGWNCGVGFISDGYYNSYGGGRSYGNEHNYAARYPASISSGLTGGYVPDPVAADLPPLIIPTNCWVRRAAYDPSGAYFGQVLMNLCRPSNRVTVTSLKTQVNTPVSGASGAQPPSMDHSASPQLSH